MKLTTAELKRIIKEEISRVLQEAEHEDKASKANLLASAMRKAGVKEEPVNEGMFKSLVSSVAKIGMSKKGKELFDEIVELQEAGVNKKATEDEKAKVIRRLEDIKKSMAIAGLEKNPGENDLTKADVARLKSLADGALGTLKKT
jgi:ribosomal protein S8E